MCPLVRLGWVLGCGLRAAGAQDGVDGKWPRCTYQPLPRWDIWALIKGIRSKPNKSLSREEIEKKIGQKKIHHGGTPQVQRQTVVHSKPTSASGAPLKVWFFQEEKRTGGLPALPLAVG